MGVSIAVDVSSAVAVPSTVDESNVVPLTCPLVSFLHLCVGHMLAVGGHQIVGNYW